MAVQLEAPIEQYNEATNGRLFFYDPEICREGFERVSEDIKRPSEVGLPEIALSGLEGIATGAIAMCREPGGIAWQISLRKDEKEAAILYNAGSANAFQWEYFRPDHQNRLSYEASVEDFEGTLAAFVVDAVVESEYGEARKTMQQQQSRVHRLYEQYIAEHPHSVSYYGRTNGAKFLHELCRKIGFLSSGIRHLHVDDISAEKAVTLFDAGESKTINVLPASNVSVAPERMAVVHGEVYAAKKVITAAELPYWVYRTLALGPCETAISYYVMSEGEEEKIEAIVNKYESASEQTLSLFK